MWPNRPNRVSDWVPFSLSRLNDELHNVELNNIDNQIQDDLTADININKADDIEQISDLLVENFSNAPHYKLDRIKRQVGDVLTETTAIPNEDADAINTSVTVIPQPVVPIRVMGLRVEESAKEPKVVDDMIPSVQTDLAFTMRLFGEGLTNDMMIAFTHTPDDYGKECNHLLNGDYKVIYTFAYKVKYHNQDTIAWMIRECLDFSEVCLAIYFIKVFIIQSCYENGRSVT